MREAARLIHAAKAQAGAFLDQGGTPDAVAFVGAEVSPLMTTLGSLEAKRIASHPAWAARLVRELAGAGVGRGSVVAANLSGSFPGLNVALACAAQALGARVAAVSSVTASTWGATDPGFTWPEIEVRLVSAGLIESSSLGISIGGDGDRGLDLEPDARALAEAIAARTAGRLHAEFLRPDSAADAVRLRLRVLERQTGGTAAVFVNTGGASAALGDDEAVLRLQSGWLNPSAARALRGGLLGHFAGRGVPVLHLLNVRDLAARWGLAR
jgi:poly-gamma-glutamate system protein